jgi:hypothetical protein
VAVGFGISTPEHVKQIAGWGADGVIIGSAMVRQLGEAASPEEGLKKLEELAKSLKAALPWNNQFHEERKYSPFFCSQVWSIVLGAWLLLLGFSGLLLSVENN